MKEKTRSRCFTILFLVSLILAAGMVFYISRVLHTDNIRLNQEGQTETLSKGWYYIDGGKKVTISEIPETIKDSGRKSLTIYRRLTGTVPDDAVLCLENYHQIVEVYVGKQKVYTYGTGNKGPAGWILGNIWNVADLPEDAQGKTMAIRLTAPNTPGKWTLPVIKLGERAAVTQMIRKECMGIAVFGILSCVLGLGLLIISVLLRLKRLDDNRQDFMYLGSFVLISTLWILTDSKIPQFLTDQLAPVYILSFLLFTLLPVPYLLFLRQICRHGKRVLECLSFLFLIQTFVCIGLYMAGIADLIVTLPVTHILMAAAVVSSIFLCLREQFYYRNRDIFFVLIGICTLAVGGMMSLLTFRPQDSGDNSFFFRCGLITFYMFLCYGSFRRGARLLKNSMKTETYRTLAYMDTMTGLGNRAAFDRDAEALQQEGDNGPFAVAVFDINNLKYINDTYGHTAGDKLIRDTALCIGKVFSEIGKSYRIGGDEFVVLMQKTSEERIEKSFAQFHELMKDCSEGNPEGLDVASGYASGKRYGSDFIYALFREADAEMYEKKGRKIKPRGM